jgi:hypothetical protein
MFKKGAKSLIITPGMLQNPTDFEGLKNFYGLCKYQNDRVELKLQISGKRMGRQHLAQGLL